MKPHPIHEKLMEFLVDIHRPFSLDDVFNETDIEKTRKTEKEIHRFISSSDEFVTEDRRFLPRAAVLKDISIRIQPTKMELEKGIFVPGHRLLPFHPLGVLMDDIAFMVEGKKIRTRKIVLKLPELHIFFSLMDMTKVPILNVEDLLEEGADLQIKVCSMRTFYNRHSFEPGDSLIVKPLDIGEGVFSIHYDPYDNYKSHIFEIQKQDRYFLETLKNVMKQDLHYPNTEKQLLYTYYHLRKSNGETWPWDLPCSALGPMLSQDKEIAFSPLPNGRTVFHFIHQDPDDLVMYPDIDELLAGGDEEEFDLHSIDGILKFLNNNNGIVVVRALLFQQITNRERFNYAKIEDYLFDGLDKPYMPAEFRKLFKALVTDEFKQIKKDFNLQYAYLPFTSARQKILELALEISRFLRYLDNRKVALDDLPRNEMIQLMELDSSFEDILEDLDQLQLQGKNDNKEIQRVLKVIGRIEDDIPQLFKIIADKLGL